MNTLMIIIAASAGILAVLSSVEQMIKTDRSKTSEGISISMLLINWIGIGLWVVYSGITASLYGGIINSINLFLFLIIFSLIIMYQEIKYWKIISATMFIFSILLVACFIYFSIKEINFKNEIVRWIIIIVGGGLTTFCFVPQLISIIKGKDVLGLSIWFFLFNAIGCALWGIYWFNIAITNSQYSAFVAFTFDVLVFAACITQTYLTYHYRKNNNLNTPVQKDNLYN